MFSSGSDEIILKLYNLNYSVGDFIQNILGHEKSKTTKIYAQLRGKLRQDLYSKYF